MKEGFSPSKGLFAATSEGRLYPSPAASQFGPAGLEILEFLGRVLGKALLEGILVELPLATFFLQQLLGRRCELRDLESMDPELARGLAELRRFEPDVIDSLGLTFTITDTSLGMAREVRRPPREWHCQRKEAPGDWRPPPAGVVLCPTCTGPPHGEGRGVFP